MQTEAHARICTVAVSAPTILPARFALGRFTMSKLMDKLQRISRGQPARIGFGSAAGRGKAPGIGLLAEAESLDLAAQAAEHADAVVLLGAAATAGGDLKNTIAGVELGDDQAEAGEGTDFVIIETSSDSSALRAREAAKLLRLPLDTPDATLRGVSALPVEALVVVEPPKGRLSVASLLGYLRLGAMAMRPVIVPLTPDFDAEQLVSIRDAGIAAVILPVKSSGDVAVLKKLRETIDAFPHPPKGKAGLDSVFASLPTPVHVGRTPAEVPVPDDEPDERLG